MTEAPYDVVWSAPARRSLTRIPEKAAVAAIEFIYSDLAGNPHRVGKPLRFELEGTFSARRGDYRVLYEIDDGDRIVHIVALTHRSDAYRRRT